MVRKGQDRLAAGQQEPAPTQPQSFSVAGLQGEVTGAEARQALARMGLTPQLLTGACAAGLQAAVNQYSSYEPSTAFGYQHWAKTVGALREALAEQGWDSRDILNAPRSVSGDGQFSIAAIRGTAATGQVGARPTNARARGRVFVDGVAVNAQLLAGSEAGGGSAVDVYGQHYQPVLGTMLALDVSARSAGDLARLPQTWLLLYFWDRSDNVVRSELSLPVDCEDGVVTRWRTRIILPPEELVGPGLAPGTVGSLPSDDVDFVIQAV